MLNKYAIDYATERRDRAEENLWALEIQALERGLYEEGGDAELEHQINVAREVLARCDAEVATLTGEVKR